MCVLSIKVPIQKKSGNLFNDPRICYANMHTYIDTFIPTCTRINVLKYVHPGVEEFIVTLQVMLMLKQ